MTATDWIDAVVARHRANLTLAEFNRAVRALSARYVERRAALPSRSPIDSAGKRAAFAGFYAPLHFLTVREIVRRLGLSSRGLTSIVDLGCGTGVASAAWALEMASATLPAIRGCDLDRWALDEARWNWRALGLAGRTSRADLTDALPERVSPEPRGTGIIAAWSLNELDAPARTKALARLIRAASGGTIVLVVEPIARSVTPWWNEAAEAFAGIDGRADESHFDVPLPPALATVNEAAGFSADRLAARWIVAGLESAA